MRKILLFILFAFYFGPTYATPSDPMSLVEVNPQDKSVEYLRYIFGNSVDVILGADGPDQVDSVLGAMSSILCAGMLLFTGLVVLYVLVSGLLDSANEGNPLGKSLSTMWVPLRMVVAMGLVLPLSGGYSAMQIGVLWTAGHGVGLANSVWAGALNHIKSTGTLYPPDTMIDHEGIAAGILKSRTCLHAVNDITRYINIIDEPYASVQQADGDTKDSGQISNGSKSVSGKTVIQRYTNAHTYKQGRMGHQNWRTNADLGAGKPQHFKDSNPCGSIAWEFPAVDGSTSFGAIKATFQDEMVRILANLDANLDPLARQIADKESIDGSPDPDDTLFLSAVETYKNEYQTAAQTAMSTLAQSRINAWADHNNAMTSIGALDAGWITAGAWYWDLQKVNAEALDLIKVTPTYEDPGSSVSTLENYDAYMAALDAYHGSKLVYDNAGNTVPALQRSTYEKDGNKNNSLSKMLDRLKGATDKLLKEPDPVTGLQNLGHSIIFISEGVFEAAILAGAFATAAESATQTVGGVIAGAMNVPLATLLYFIEANIGLLKLVIIALMPLALFLAFYLPATPLILWISGVAGWFILLIEAVIAAPIWAASHAMPEGNGFVGQRAMAGYMVLLSLFLRPTLMLFGLFASMLLMIAMSKVVILLFYPSMSSMGSGHIAGIASYFGTLAILVFLIINIAHRAYGLIHEIPDKVLRYIGGGGENLGEGEQERQGKAFFIAGAAKLEGGAAKGMQREAVQGSKNGGGGDGDKDNKNGATSQNTKTNKDLSTGN